VEAALVKGATTTVIHHSGFLRALGAVVLVTGIVSAANQKALQVNVIDGEGAFNDIKRGQVRTPVVEVRDDDGRPVQGAKVVFQLPDMGASATFGDNSRTLIANTDEQGRATAPGLKPNKTEGSYLINVTVSKDGAVGHAEIRQNNTLAGGDQAMQSNGHGKLKILIAIAGAAGGAAIAAVRAGGGSKSSSTTAAVPPTTLTVGAVTIGGPR
jgi:hypothetical protein